MAAPPASTAGGHGDRQPESMAMPPGAPPITVGRRGPHPFAPAPPASFVVSHGDRQPMSMATPPGAPPLTVGSRGPCPWLRACAADELRHEPWGAAAHARGCAAGSSAAGRWKRQPTRWLLELEEGYLYFFSSRLHVALGTSWCCDNFFGMLE
ncbi:unnamed protein product [Urochloa humidicola]